MVPVINPGNFLHQQLARRDLSRRNLSRRIWALALGAGLFFMIPWFSAAAEITLPRLEMASRTRMNDGKLVVSSMISTDLALTGAKYNFLLGFTLEAADIAKAFSYRNFMIAPFPYLPGGATDVSPDDYNALVDQLNNEADRLNNQAFLGFRIAKATAKGLFGLPLELSYFLGQGDDFCTGDDFSSIFGIAPFGTDFKGFLYFPDGIGGVPTRQYNGIYGVRGTGISLALTKWTSFVPILYLYQDFASTPYYLNPGTSVFGGGNLYSGDLRMLIYHGALDLEVFGGVTTTPNLDTSIRGGLMFHLGSASGAEFFAQGGIPGWTLGKDLSIDNLFFLMEPRLHFNNFGIIVTFFYHPVEYIHILTDDERGRADLNVKFQIGKADSGFTGGIELGGNLKLAGLQDFTFHLSPFVSFISGGLRWDAKIQLNPSDYTTPAEMLELFIGVRTAF